MQVPDYYRTIRILKSPKIVSESELAFAIIFGHAGRYLLVNT
jgi:hypothetical protein